MDEKIEQSCTKASSSRGGIVAGVPGGGVFTLSILLVGWSWLGVVAAGVAIPRGHPLQIQDVPSDSEEWSVAELSELLANTEPQERERKLANLLEWMQQLRQQHEQEEAAVVAAAIESEMASSNGGNARNAMPPPLLHSSASGGTSSRVSPQAGQIGEEEGDDDGRGTGKRGSFMSLCHFKICNMGRKRNLRYNPWTRV